MSTCIVCGSALTGRRTRFCSEACTKKYKREQTHLKRPPRDHICRYKTCGREMRIGRPRVEENEAARAFARPSAKLPSPIQSDDPGKPEPRRKEVCASSEQEI